MSAIKFFIENEEVCVETALSKFDDIHKCREWLVRNIEGLGYKEASHFLRNIGFGERIAIFDRHILKNLKHLNIIEQIPKSISRAKYMQIERNMKELATRINIPVSHFDLLLWYKETEEIFKRILINPPFFKSLVPSSYVFALEQTLFWV